MEHALAGDADLKTCMDSRLRGNDTFSREWRSFAGVPLNAKEGISCVISAQAEIQRMEHAFAGDADLKTCTDSRLRRCVNVSMPSSTKSPA